MPKRVTVIPLDGSELADQLVPRLLPLLHRDDDEAVLLRVVSRPEELKEADAHLARVHDLLSVQMINAIVALRVGDPASEICKLAQDLRPQLVAMATRARSGPARWVLGSVAERVLRESPVPMLLANPEAIASTEAQPQHAFSFGRLLVALDGSGLAHQVLPLVAHVATRYESEITLLHVTSEADAADPPVVAQLERTILEPMAARLRERGRPVALRVVGGEPAEKILGVAEHDGADCIAMTTHGRTGMSRWVFGSVAEKVLRSAARPMLVVRTGGVGALPTLLDTVL